MKFTRRELLEDALFAATLAATGGLASRSAWAAESKPSGRVIGPNDQIRVAVLGVKGRGRDHVGGYLKFSDVTIATICDCDLSVVGPALEQIKKAGKPEPQVVQDLRKVIEDPNIDAVSIATPNHWHSLAAIWAMQAGKDVYVEKPVSHNVHEGRVMVDTARKYKRICQAGTQIRSTQGTKDAMAFLHSGKLGKVKVARGLCYKPRNSIGIKEPGMCPSSVDFDIWLGPAPKRMFHQNQFHYNWHWRWDTGNGDLGNQGIHQMDVARWGLGKDGLPTSVIGFGGRLGYKDDGETPNTHVAVLDYGDAQLIFETRGLKTNDYKGARIGNVFHCEKGYLVMTGYSAGAAFDLDGNLIQKFDGGGDHYRNFIDCMRSRKSEDLNGEIIEGHLSSAMCHLGNISYLLGEQTSFGRKPAAFDGNEAALETYERFEQHLADNGVDMQQSHFSMGPKLKIDPKKEKFVGNKQANAMLFREGREGFRVPKKA